MWVGTSRRTENTLIFLNGLCYLTRCDVTIVTLKFHTSPAIVFKALYHNNFNFKSCQQVVGLVLSTKRVTFCLIVRSVEASIISGDVRVTTRAHPTKLINSFGKGDTLNPFCSVIFQ
jgi:hypothetical protein